MSKSPNTNDELPDMDPTPAPPGSTARDKDLRIEELERAKDAAYEERNQCVALIARLALLMGWGAGVTRTAIDGWDEEWHGCVYIDLPSGQVSWHYHDSHAPYFAGLPHYDGVWDGHDTPEKYRRVYDTALQGGK